MIAMKVLFRKSDGRVARCAGARRGRAGRGQADQRPGRGAPDGRDHLRPRGSRAVLRAAVRQRQGRRQLRRHGRGRRRCAATCRSRTGTTTGRRIAARRAPAGGTGGRERAGRGQHPAADNCARGSANCRATARFTSSAARRSAPTTRRASCCRTDSRPGTSRAARCRARCSRARQTVAAESGAPSRWIAHCHAVSSDHIRPIGVDLHRVEPGGHGPPGEDARGDGGASQQDGAGADLRVGLGAGAGGRLSDHHGASAGGALRGRGVPLQPGTLRAVPPADGGKGPRRHGLSRAPSSRW